MDDNNNKNQPGQTASDYQKILDEYAASIKPETTPDTAAPEEVKTIKLDEVKDTANEKTFLKDINNPQLESPVHPSLAANLEVDDDYPKMPSNEPEKISPINSLKNDFVPPTPPTPVQEPVKTPEQIKSEIDKILATDTTPDQPLDDTHQSPKLNIFKILFIISLITFFGVAGVLAYTLLLNPSTNDKKTDSDQQSTITPTSTVSNGSCELNGSIYQIGESFASADGCNTCSCQSADVITCTEKACSITPEVIPATKSAVKTTITPASSSSKSQSLKTYENKEIGFSFNYPITLGEFTFSLQKGETGNEYLGKFSKNSDIYIGGISTDFTAGRGGSFFSFSGYDNKNKIITFYGARTYDKSFVIDPTAIKKIYKNKNGVEVVLIVGYTAKDDYPSPVGLGEGNIGALININNKTYPGIAFQFPAALESEMVAILDSFKTTN